MNDPLLAEEYRPQKIEDVILPNRIKSVFQGMIDTESISNMTLVGPPGCGKTTVARALCEQLNLDYLFVNGSKDGNIDTLRTKVQRFASAVSLSGNVKVVIFDEADWLNAQSTQPSLRGFMDEFSNCRFIFTANVKNRIIDAIYSRAPMIEFVFNNQELADMARELFARLCEILDSHEVQYDKSSLAQLVIKYAPDWRQTFNILQPFIQTGEVPNNIESRVSDQSFDRLFEYLSCLLYTSEQKKFKPMRQWVVENMGLDAIHIIRGIYDRMENEVKSSHIPALVLLLADYQHKNAFAADRELNLVACLVEIMSEVEFK